MQIFSQLHSGFDTERLRKKLLQRRKYKALLGTYFAGLPEIQDHNTPEFWDNKFSDSEKILQFPMSKDRNALIASLIVKNSTVLNIGAGKGHLEERVFRNVGNNITWFGTDFTNETLQKLKKNYPTYTFLKTGIDGLSFVPNTFDTICLLEVLEHISPRQTVSVLKKINSLLKPGGKAIISVPVNEGLEAMLPENPNSHLRVYSKKLLAFEFMITGYKIKKVISLTAFARFYKIKKLINSIFKLKRPNNLIFILEKV